MNSMIKKQKQAVCIATWSSVVVFGAYFLIGCGGGTGTNPDPTATPKPGSTPTPNPNGRLEIQGPAGVPCGYVVDNVSSGTGHCGAQTSYTVKAFDGNNQEITVDQSKVTWDRTAGTSLNPTAGGNAFSQNLGLTTIRARVNGLEGRKVVRVGFPLQVAVTAQGITPETGFRLQAKTFDGQFQVVDNIIDEANFGGSLAPVSFKWVGSQGFFTPTTYDGHLITIKANPTQGDFQFLRWTVGGQQVSTDPNLIIDPKNPPAGAPSLDTDPYPTLNLVAVYGPRTVVSGEYTPNYVANFHRVQWNLSQTRVTFSTAGQYSEDKKAKAIAGLDLWKRTTGNNNLFTVIANNDIANADVIIAFPTSPNSAETHPGQPGWVTGYNLSDDLESKKEGLGGLTMWGIDAGNPDTGVSHRLIHLYGSANASITPVTAHEFGHALGIDGHSGNPEDIMAPSVGPNAFPLERDVNTAMTLVSRATSL
jgi:hypothetical protein